jgi:hypothetical protein
MMEGGSPIDASEGPGPIICGCLMPAEHWEIRDTWHTFGLKGTSSRHVALAVPDENLRVRKRHRVAGTLRGLQSRV